VLCHQSHITWHGLINQSELDRSVIVNTGSTVDITSVTMNTAQQRLTTRGQIIALREEGLTVRAIADRLAVSTSTVKRWIRRYAETDLVMSVCHRVNGIPGYDTVDPKTIVSISRKKTPPPPRLTTRDEDAAIIAAI
ncbi:putative Homeodomain-like domain-containing protein 11, partial [Homarus americanus]